MAELGELSVKVPIKFSEKAQKELYETCVAYKELAETRGIENEKLQNRLERLLTILCNDCDISVSWDGLRGFWNVELTEDGCLMRDRACKAEAENDKLRELVQYILDENYGDDWFCMKAKEFGLEARY